MNDDGSKEYRQVMTLDLCRDASGPRLEVRDEGVAGSEQKMIVGYAARFEPEISEDLGGFREVVMPGAFARSIAEGADVRALVDHDHSRVLGRTKSGTLRMWEDDRGLRVEIDPPSTSAARDLAESISRGDVTGMSFGFTTRRDSWRTDDGEKVRELHDLDLFDISVVTFPAYPSTGAALRSLEQWQAAEEAPERRDEPVMVKQDDSLDADQDTETEQGRLRLAEAWDRLKATM